jgi:hypothetical protein
MGKTVEQWRNEIKNLDKGSLILLNQSFNVIKEWKFFDAEYSWTGYKFIQTLIQSELKMRESD